MRCPILKECAKKTNWPRLTLFIRVSVPVSTRFEEVLQNLRRESAFFAVDDTNDGVTEKRSGGYFKKRTFTVFLMMRYRISDMAERQAALEVCRQLFRQVHSRMLVDRENLDNELVYLNTDNVYSRELGEYFISGCTGLYFMIDVSEPVSLIYDSDEWEE